MLLVWLCEAIFDTVLKVVQERGWVSTAIRGQVPQAVYSRQVKEFRVSDPVWPGPTLSPAAKFAVIKSRIVLSILYVVVKLSRFAANWMDK